MVMEAFVLVVGVAVIIGSMLALTWRRGTVARRQRRSDDARAEARRWYERLGGQVMNLHTDDPAGRQALSDAGERYNAAGGQLQQARTQRQFELARETALEGLAYIRAARVAMGIDPGPELPPLAAAQGTGRLAVEREVTVDGNRYKAGPQPLPDTPYYYPGGLVEGRAVPAGWYSQPVWRTAVGAGVGVLGGMLVVDALLSPVFGDLGYAGEPEATIADAATQGAPADGGTDSAAESSGSDFGGGGF